MIFVFFLEKNKSKLKIQEEMEIVYANKTKRTRHSAHVKAWTIMKLNQV
jgi:hypothetical protein